MDGFTMPPPMQQPPPPMQQPPPPMHEWPQKKGLPQQFYAHNGSNVVPLPGMYSPVMGMGVVVPLTYIFEDVRKKEAEVKEEKKNVQEEKKKLQKLTKKVDDQNEIVNFYKRQSENTKKDIEKLKKFHADEVKKLNAEVTKLNDEKICLTGENKRILEENQRLLDVDAKNKEMLAQWNVQREALTHIMAGTYHVDITELSKARNTASFQPAPPPPPVGLKRSWPQVSDGETQDDTQPAKKK